jgi:branched-chain amino acid transport system ATP-binding protein
MCREPILGNSLAISDLSAAYGHVRALDDVSLVVAEGETVALLGTNGNGKSSLMKCVMGLLRPSAGAIVARIDGESINLVGLATEQIVARGVILVPEGRHLLPKLTVEENLYLGALRQQARPHIRRNLGNETSFPRELAERALGHRVGDATETAYRRSDALERRRALMDAWASYCEPSGDNVVPIRRAR